MIYLLTPNDFTNTLRRLFRAAFTHSGSKYASKVKLEILVFIIILVRYLAILQIARVGKVWHLLGKE